jgi:SsrA-binding protein
MEICNNKQALWHYEPIQKLEAGMILFGPEVKSLKQKRVDLKGSFISIKNNVAWLIGAHIAPYGPAAGVQKNYEPKRQRKLLLTKKELNFLRGNLTQKGLTIVPLRIYTTRGLIKLELAVVKGKKEFDKKAKIKKRDIDRDVKRTLKEY